MSIPKPVYNPPFNVTRASHSVLTVKDLAVSRNFYVDLIGFIVSDEDKDTIYLRGVAEACHHSLVLKRAKGEPQAERVGMSIWVTPNSFSASTTALTTTASAGVLPPSPPARTPSGLLGESTSLISVMNGRRSSARGMA